MKALHAGTAPEIPAELSDASRKRIEAQALRRGREFIKGPIPLPWLARAFALPGKAGAVAVLLWFMAGMNGPRQIRVNPKLLQRFQVGRKAGYRAVDALTAAGLVTAERAVGKCAVVSILP